MVRARDQIWHCIRRKMTVGAEGEGDQAVSQPNSANGVAVGVVARNDDPEGRGRVQVKLPHYGEEEGWARVARPITGQRAGSLSPPEVGQEVLVAFEGGDIARPIVIGTL
jgi:uncharacterized protein involved in type VI secretion and phage assembly